MSAKAKATGEVRLPSASGEGEYVCLVPIDHTADRCIYPVGAVIRLDHLKQVSIDRLVRFGFVKPIVPASLAQPSE